MAQFFEDFFGAQYWHGRSPLPGWTNLWSTNGAWAAENNEQGPSGRVAVISGTNNSRRCLALDAVGTPADADLLVLFRSTSTSNSQGMFSVRASGGAGSENGYSLFLQAGQLALVRFSGGANTTLDTASFSWSTSTWYWLRLRANGTNIWAKAWADGVAEPTTGGPDDDGWLIKETDSTHASGSVGIGVFTSTGSKRVGVVAVGTGGDTPPTGPAAHVPGDPRQLALHGGITAYSTPQAVTYNGRTYFGYVSNTGDIMVSALTHSTGAVEHAVVSASFQADIHVAPSLVVLPSGRIMAFYCEYSGDVHWRTTTNPEDLSAWGTENSSAFGSGFDSSYAQAVRLSDRIVLHRRRNWSSGRSRMYSETTDAGETWDDGGALFDNGGQRPYMSLVKHPTTDRIDYLVNSGHPNETTASLYHFYRGADGEYYESDGTLIGDSTDLPVTPSDATLIWDASTTGERTWPRDIAYLPDGTLVALFSAIDSSTHEHRIMFARWTGSAWATHEVAETGDAFTTDTDYSSAGGAIDPKSAVRVWVPREVSSGVFDLFEYTSADGGETWSGSNRTDDIGDWPHNALPFVPVDRDEDVGVLWLGGQYTAATSYLTGIFALSAEAVEPDPSLTAATIAATATAPGEITVTRPTAATGADSVALYVAESADDLPEEGPEAGATLLSDDDEWPPEVLGGLGIGATRYFAEYATNDEGTVRSNIASATTETPPPPEAFFQITNRTHQSAEVYVPTVDVPGSENWSAFEFETTLLADAEYANPIDQSGILEGPNRFFHFFDGLAELTDYRTRGKLFDNVAGEWSDWFEVLWSTPENPATAETAHFTEPDGGEAVRGDAVSLAWTGLEGRNVTAIEISDDFGDTYAAPLAGATSEGVTFDSTEHADGFWIARLTLDDDSQILHPGFIVDNAETAVDHRSLIGVDVAKYWTPGTPLYAGAVQTCQGDTGSNRCRVEQLRFETIQCLPIPAVFHQGARGPSSLGPIDPVELTFNKGAVVTAMMSNWNNQHGSGQWHTDLAGGFMDMGVALVSGGSFDGGNDTFGIRAAIHVPKSLDWVKTASTIGDGEFVVTVGRVAAHDTTSDGPTDTFSFRVPIRVRASVEWFWLYACYSISGIFLPYYITLSALPTGEPLEYRIRATAHPARGLPGHPLQIGAQRAAIIDETVTLPFEFGCGHASMFSRKTAGTRAHANRVSFHSFSACALDDCADPPEPPPPAPPDEPIELDEMFLPEPCALWWGLYDDDGVTLLREATTSPTTPGFGAAQPYLLDPDQFFAHYGEQELDFAEGRASLGRAQVMIADVHQIPGDQDSGWVTEFVDLIHGRRNRLLRFVDEDRGWVTIADGPAGEPKMHKYAAYTWQIRDTRETERRARAFVRSSAWALPAGGVEIGYGRWVDAVGTHYLIPPTDPLTATYDATPYVGAPQGIVELTAGYWTYVGGYVVNPAVVIPPDVEARMMSRDRLLEGGEFVEHTWPDWEILWRPAGTSDPWHVIVPGMQTPVAQAWPAQPLVFIGDAVVGGEAVRAASGIPIRTLEDSPDLPTDDQSIDIVVRHLGEPTEDLPLYVELDEDEHPITDGQLLKALYDGEFSPRDADGNVRPTGIRYDAEAVLAMDVPVRLRITEPVKDLRDWTERHIYRVRGYTPALDHDGRISPVSDLPPDGDEYDYGSDWVDSAVDINNAITEPAPSWDAGERIVNEVRTSYPRDYIDTHGEFQTREVTNVWRVQDSLHGEQVVEIDALAYRGIGSPDGSAIGEEPAHRLATARGTVLIARYGEGAQGFQLAVMREHTWMLRAGSWVTVDLSWFPGYDIGRRGMATVGQIVAIADLDCAWRLITFEEVLPVDIPDVPPPAGSGEIAHAALFAPAHQSTDVTLEIAGASVNETRTWEVHATVEWWEVNEPPVLITFEDITSQLSPEPTTISTAVTQHTYDTGFQQGGAEVFEGDNLVRVAMRIRIKEGATTIAEREVVTQYTTEDSPGS